MTVARVRDRNRIPKVMRELVYLARHRVEVGIFGDKAPRLLATAQLNEFGTQVEVTAALMRFLRAKARERGISQDVVSESVRGDTIRVPERSFIRSTFDANERRIGELGEQQIGRVMRGETTGRSALWEIGAALQQMVIDRVVEGDFTPNDPLTVAMKGHDRPLIGRTGVLETTRGIHRRVVAAR